MKPIRLSDLKPGDHIRGFEGFGCIPDKAVRTVQMNAAGLYVKCRNGNHYLDGQEDNDGILVGLEKIE